MYHTSRSNKKFYLRFLFYICIHAYTCFLASRGLRVKWVNRRLAYSVICRRWSNGIAIVVKRTAISQLQRSTRGVQSKKEEGMKQEGVETNYGSIWLFPRWPRLQREKENSRSRRGGYQHAIHCKLRSASEYGKTFTCAFQPKSKATFPSLFYRRAHVKISRVPSFRVRSSRCGFWKLYVYSLIIHTFPRFKFLCKIV